MNMSLQPSLSEEEMSELESFLLFEATPEYCMSLSMLDGFFPLLFAGK